MQRAHLRLRWGHPGRRCRHLSPAHGSLGERAPGLRLIAHWQTPSRSQIVAEVLKQAGLTGPTQAAAATVSSEPSHALGVSRALQMDATSAF